MFKEKQLYLADELQTVSAGMRIGACLGAGMTVFLDGQLGAGKTTLTRGILQALGYSGAVKSPTYTLVEPYEQLLTTIYHFDLYRLGDPEELEYMGIREYFDSDSICLVEWPERGLEYLPEPDVILALIPKKDGLGAVGRQLTITTVTAQGDSVLAHWIGE
ncbi:MAG: tRNA threonylcarbamoyladenosine biosynthesis protein TsaE [Pseudohongiellaceae bacterium]|jgi:tRNA threonylcarbamoyladenosine biosynthesis protein TsaE